MSTAGDAFYALADMVEKTSTPEPRARALATTLREVVLPAADLPLTKDQLARVLHFLADAYVGAIVVLPTGEVGALKGRRKTLQELANLLAGVSRDDVSEDALRVWNRISEGLMHKVVGNADDPRVAAMAVTWSREAVMLLRLLHWED